MHAQMTSTQTLMVTGSANDAMRGEYWDHGWLGDDELIVDNFAGGGGASTGIKQWFGRDPDIAVNHDPLALAMFKANHPRSKVYNESVWDIDPRKVCGGRPVGLAWFSPDCTHHSKAKNGAPRSKEIRGLAWVTMRWVGTVRPRVLMLENVEEFKNWGPMIVNPDGSLSPCPRRKGKTFQSFVRQLKGHGYHVEYRELTADDVGAPTRRKRLFLVARCDGRPIQWPNSSDVPDDVRARLGAGHQMDFDTRGQSMYRRAKALVPNSQRRVARGIMKYVLNSRKRFARPTSEHPDDRGISFYFLAKHYGGHVTPGSSLHNPISTITCIDHHALVEVQAVPAVDVGEARAQTRINRIRALLRRYSKPDGKGYARLGQRHLDGQLVHDGTLYQIIDIRTRALTAAELYRCQGFPEGHIIDQGPNGEALTSGAQIRMCGNSVPPQFSRALAAANFPDPRQGIDYQANALDEKASA